eukprot:6175577-Pleurochrysis_carterae.AAC.5
MFAPCAWADVIAAEECIEKGVDSVAFVAADVEHRDRSELIRRAATDRARRCVAMRQPSQPLGQQRGDSSEDSSVRAAAPKPNIARPALGIRAARRSSCELLLSTGSVASRRALRPKMSSLALRRDGSDGGCAADRQQRLHGRLHRSDVGCEAVEPIWEVCGRPTDPICGCLALNPVPLALQKGGGYGRPISYAEDGQPFEKSVVLLEAGHHWDGAC